MLSFLWSSTGKEAQVTEHMGISQIITVDLGIHSYSTRLHMPLSLTWWTVKGWGPGGKWVYSRYSANPSGTYLLENLVS